MKRLTLALVLGLSTLAVQAQTHPATPPEAAKPAVESSTANAAESVEPRTVNDTGCVRETGTKLKRRDKNGCTGAPGESYSRAEIDRSGATDTADAVRKLTTRGTVHRGH